VSTSLGRPALAAIALCLSASSLQAQLGVQKERNVPTSYAITNARIVPAAGQVIDRGTIVIRNGLITAVGPAVTAPADARVIDATGMTIYPGFVDAYSNLGYEAAAPAQQGGVAFGGRGNAGAPATPRVDPAPNSLNRPGLQPEVTALSLLVDDADYAAAQSAGFTTALTAPANGIFVGQSAVISLRAGDVQSVLLKSPVGMHIGFNAGGRGAGGGGGYPGSLLGVFSALRQGLLDAQRYGQIQAMYAANPRGMARPDNDPSSAALLPALKGQMPVYFSANTQREIERALDMADSFRLKPVIVGGQEAHLVMDRLKAGNVPVLYSLAFTQPGGGAGGGGRGGRGGGGGDQEPIRVLRQRVQEPKTPGELQKAGITFALHQGGNGFAQFLPNLQRVVASGLSKDDALRAITVTPATLFGVADRIGTIEVGKIADLTLTRGDLFDPSVKVTELFVDGHPVELQAAATASATPAAGQWNVTVNISNSDRPITLFLTQEGSTVRGTMQGSLGTVPIGNGSIDPAGMIRFTASITMTTTEEATFSGTITGDTISGTVVVIGEPQAGKFTGTRAPSGRRPPGTEDR
jgi:imidazolonepropionase-like amidohydrolase